MIQWKDVDQEQALIQAFKQNGLPVLEKANPYEKKLTMTNDGDAIVLKPSTKQKKKSFWGKIRQMYYSFLGFDESKKEGDVQPEKEYQHFSSATDKQYFQRGMPFLSARVINARGIFDCRTAITLLRNNEEVVCVMESISDPVELRRLVDMLSGACYSLMATITKISRSGVYLLAPKTLAVYADQITAQMNSINGVNSPKETSSYGSNIDYSNPIDSQNIQHKQPTQGVSSHEDTANDNSSGYAHSVSSQEDQTKVFYLQPMPRFVKSADVFGRTKTDLFATDDIPAAN